DFQKDIVKIQTIFGGKNPHPNWLVGGVPSPLNVDGTGAVGANNMTLLNMVGDICDRTAKFIDDVYIPDLVAVAGFYKDWAKIGGGLSSQNVLSYGEFPEIPNDYSNNSLALPSGVIIGGDLTKVQEVDLKDPTQVQEWVTHAWYKYADESKGLHPFDGVTEPSFALGAKTKGSRAEIKEIDESAKYSWVKSPRWKGHAVEVGPLARYIVAYARGRKDIKDQVDGLLKTLDVPVTALFSTLGRTAARGLECQWAAHRMRKYYDELIATIKAGDLATANMDKWEPASWPEESKGAGPCEAPRGALGHWIKIKNRKIDQSQAVVPTTWNAGPRDAKGQIGAYEAALLNTPMAKPEQPVEILRTIHSFDPCLACASHVMSAEGEEIVKVTIR
ncbi:MAG TPA: nickel-dependent hydrogenase large subunit, partial [Vicinamibacterales bacterium]